MIALASLSKAARIIALDRFRLLQPHMRMITRYQCSDVEPTDNRPPPPGRGALGANLTDWYSMPSNLRRKSSSTFWSPDEFRSRGHH